MMPAKAPAYADWMAMFNSSMWTPYHAIFSRSYCTTSCCKPAVRSSFTSSAPGMGVMMRAAACPRRNNSSGSSPKIFTATSALLPVSSSLNRNWMGWVNSNDNSGNTWSTDFICSTSSSRVLALVHSSFGLSRIITSASSIDMGSVGTSAVPIFETMWFTSGKLSSRSFSTAVDAATVVSRLLPGGTANCMARSPSSRSGRNTEPIVEIRQMEIKRMSAAAGMAILPKRKFRDSQPAYCTRSVSIIRSPKVFFSKLTRRSR